MKILKCLPNLPAPLSYLEVIKKYQNWDNINNFASREEALKIVNEEMFFYATNKGSHLTTCKTCQSGVDCDVLEYEKKLTDKRYEKLNNRISTMKRCPALIDLFKTGVIIPAWTDMSFEAIIVDDDINKKTILALDSNREPIATIHTKPQVDFHKMNFDVSHNFSIKFSLPYRIFSKELIMHKSIFWLGELPFRVVEGIQDTAGLSTININTIWKLENGQRWEVKKGTPLFWILEIPRNSVNQKHEVVEYDNIDWDKLKKIDYKDRNVKTINGYRNNQKKMLE
jgi:hypothetical protein